jgi:hypothetical protein
MKQFITLFMSLVVVLSAFPETLKAQQNEADFKITGLMEGCSTSPTMLKIASDHEGGARLVGMLSPLTGHDYGSLVVYDINQDNTIVDSSWLFPSDFNPNPKDIYVEGDKIVILIRAASSNNINVATMVLSSDSLGLIGGGWYPLIDDAVPERMVSINQALVNHDGQAELWDVSSFDPDIIPLGEESVFSANFLDGQGFGFVGSEAVHVFDLDGIELFSYSIEEGNYTPWGIGFTSNHTCEAYTLTGLFHRTVVDYSSGDSYAHLWEENHISYSFGEMRIGLVAEEEPGMSLMGNHTEIWAGQNFYDLKDFIPEIQYGDWTVYIRDTDYDLDHGIVWLTGSAQQFGGPQRFSWYGKVPINESPLEGIPFVFADVMNPEKHDFLAYPNPMENTVVIEGFKGEIEIYSQIGEKVKVLNVEHEMGQKFDVSDLPNGVYQFHCPSQGSKGSNRQMIVL